MTLPEHLAYRHLAGAMKATRGRSDVRAQAEARESRGYSQLMSDDPDVLALAKDGYLAIAARAAERILTQHTGEVFLNRCPRCKILARTPTARQCRACKHDWHTSSGLISQQKTC